MKVLFIAQYGPLAASSRTRVFDYLPLLRSAGLACDVQVVAPDGLMRLSSQGIPQRLLYYLLSWLRTAWMGWACVVCALRYDVVFIQKVLFSFPIPQLLSLFRHKIFYDFDDAIFTLENPDENWLARLRTRRRARGLPVMLKASGHAIVENDYTAEFASQFCDQISKITGPIDTGRYVPGDRRAREKIVLGWIGSPSTTPYLDLIRAPLTDLGRRYPNLELCLIGAADYDVDKITVRHLDWGLETEVGHLQTFDIGLMPLPDDHFTRGKGGYKLLQYMSMGFSVVASPVEINREIVTHGQTGFLAQTDAEWTEYLEILIKNEGLRAQMGVSGREKVKKEYSLEKSCAQLLHLLKDNKV